MMRNSFWHIAMTVGLVVAGQGGASAQQNLTLHYDKPAEFFEEALVIGNGTLGGIVYGGTDTDVISLNDMTLWTGEPVDVSEMGNRSDNEKALKEIRAALEKEDYRSAEKLQLKLQTRNSQQYQPLGTLKISLVGKDGTATQYSRQLNLTDARVKDSFVKGGVRFEREYFCSAPDSVMVIHLTADRPFSARISLDSKLPHETRVTGGELVSDGYAPYNNNHDYDANRGVHYRTLVKVLAGGSGSGTDSSLALNDVTDAVILVANATSFNGFDKDPVKAGRDYKTAVRRIMDRAAGRRLVELQARQVDDYRKYFDRVSLNLGKTDEAIASLPTNEQLFNYTEKNERNPELEALYFQYGRYLLISSSRTHAIPANLQGIWNESVTPPWSCNYTVNINLEENYWPAETANLGEMHMPLMEFIRNASKTGAVTARTMYGIDRGWCLSHNSDPWAKTTPVGSHNESPSWANWNVGGAWVSTHIWEHYQFSQDKEFLREFYPYLKGAAEFCLDWMVEKDGHLITSPSTSPENYYKMPDGFQGSTLYGGTADLAIIRECLTDARNAAEVLKQDASFRNEVDGALKKMLPYRIGRKGNLQEWFFDWDDQDPHHRHQSHLIGLYPGHQIVTQEDLLAACAKTLEIKGDNSTGWSTGWRVNLFARLHDAKGAYHIYRKLLRYISPDGYKGNNAKRGGGTYPNLLDAHSPFQIDGNFGGCAGVVEMLMQSTENTITLLPAVPDEWKDGSVKGICARGGFTVDMEWKDGRVTSFTISSVKGGKTTVCYNGKQKTIKLNKNGQKTVEE